MNLRMPRLIRNDFFRKFIALVFAVLLWFYVRGQLRDVEIFHAVPVTLSYDSNVVSLEKELVTVNLTVRGSRQRLQQIRSTDLLVNAAIPSAAAGGGGLSFYDLHLGPQNVTLPAGASLVQIEPSRQMIPMDRIVTRRDVPVRVRYTGSLREGYQISKCTVVPSQVDVRGPAKIVGDIRELVTEPVVLDENLMTGFEIEAKLVPIPRVVANVESVHVQIEISRQTTQQVYKDLPVFVMTSPATALEVADPLPLITVTLRGPQNILETLDGFVIRPFVDLSAAAAPGRYRRPVQVWCGGPAGVVTEAVVPGIVEVTLARRPDAPEGALGAAPAPPPPPAAAPKAK